MEISASPAMVQAPREPVKAEAQPVRAPVVAREEAPVVEKKKSEVDVEQVHMALAEINHAMQTAAIGVRFEFDQTAEKMVTRVVDSVSGELIHQMPSEEVLRMSKALDKLQGLLVHQAV
jgi:flagellar protein FlaG